MLARLLIVAALLTIAVSLGAALVYLVRDRPGSRRTVRALSVRIGLLIALFVLLLVSYALGWIEPHGLAPHPAPPPTPQDRAHSQ